MRLFHFSDDSDIAAFEPRPVRVPSVRAPGREWLNGPLVWAIDADHDFMYLFPRDCPRILLWATADMPEAERRHWLGDWRAVAYVERHWLERLEAETIHRYEMPAEGFEDLDDAGMWVARRRVIPLERTAISRLDQEFAPRRVELRVVDSLRPLKGLWNTSLHVSGIRLRNARDWE
ncbi:hypothetical protein GR210_33400 [Rhizobium leguminosarum]|uniref:DUF6886 family protein n=1 Tax=Rhizobium leguminosarum TaxID=384 RepID=UPI00040E1E97|nr:DUF6886 family protein [Rhizobium leguminosarum]MBY5316981.1 hypothetical protein [Rhizobium leguminosarum]MBY5394979.1 hypothetical protein [Rhizobium leguminosarum]MBY5797869.1 hypothetical protein [Rhizobium leguminosarum]NEH53670.1 hypothetical protein [Rhizobium leguminosarum]NEH59973.1 hypothetical protein [Rhizobium leguminosarum]